MRTIGEDLAKDVTINKFKLDEENEIRGQLYEIWAERYAEAKVDVDSAKDKLDLVIAQRTLYYSNNPIDGVKPTGDNVKAMVEQDTEVQTTKDVYRQTLAKRYTMDAAMNAINSKDSGVDNLVKLYLNKYYEVRQTGGDSVSDAMNDSLNRRKE